MRFTTDTQLPNDRGLRVARTIVAFLAIALTVSLASSAQDLKSFEERTTEHVLDNGWTFILVERDVAPVFSFATFANVGGAQEVPGVTGIAHMFEHMAFKGSENIGTTDYEAEAEALAEVEATYSAYQEARLSGAAAEQLEALHAEFKKKEAAAQEFVVVNEFGDILDREGGTGLNAFTNSDFTGYFYSLPANRFELFCYLESERFLTPVFREFYTERDVVQEERRMRTESQPVGRLVEQFLATAFVAHPYKQPVVGYMSDLESITASDAKAFYETHYTPNNMTDGSRRRHRRREVDCTDREVLRPCASRAEATAAPDRGTGSGRREADHPARSGAASVRRGVPQALWRRTGRARVRRDRQHPLRRPNLPSLPLSRTGQEDRPDGWLLLFVPGDQIPNALDRIRHPCAWRPRTRRCRPRCGPRWSA